MIFDAPEPLNELKKLLDYDIAGEARPKLSAFCLVLTYKTMNPANILPVGESSAGKTNLMRGVLKLFPIAEEREMAKHSQLVTEILNNGGGIEAVERLEQAFWAEHDGIMLDGLSAQALKRYMTSSSWFTWDHKILAMGELDNALTAAPALRTLASEGGGAALVTEKSKSGKFYTQLYVSKGRPLLFATTANEKVEEQFANRCVMIEVGSSNRKAVHMKIAERRTKRDVSPVETMAKVRVEVKAMPCVTDVVIPFSDKFADVWYDFVPSSNRTLTDFMRLIDGVALLHHAHRDIDEDGFLVATPVDYDLARQITCGMKLKLSAPLLRVLHAFERLEEKDPVTRQLVRIGGEVNGHLLSEVASEACKSDRQAYDDVAELMNHALVKSGDWANDPDASEYKKKKIYWLSDFAKKGIELKTWKELTGEESGAYKVNVDV